MPTPGRWEGSEPEETPCLAPYTSPARKRQRAPMSRGQEGPVGPQPADPELAPRSRVQVGPVGPQPVGSRPAPRSRAQVGPVGSQLVEPGPAPTSHGPAQLEVRRAPRSHVLAERRTQLSPMAGAAPGQAEAPPGVSAQWARL